jgi:hypothetical protein
VAGRRERVASSATGKGLASAREETGATEVVVDSPPPPEDAAAAATEEGCAVFCLWPCTRIRGRVAICALTGRRERRDNDGEEEDEMARGDAAGRGATTADASMARIG